MPACPCQSSLSYDKCCGVYHQTHKWPDTAETLMRSRYAAFVVKDASYLVETHAPQTRETDLKASLMDTFNEVEWLGLEILEKQEGEKNDREGRVKFRVEYKNEDGQKVMEEHSQFIKKKKRWFYLGEVKN